MRVVPYTYENTVCACHAVHKQNTLFNNELKTEMTTIIPLANRARSHIALTRPSWVSLASGERASRKSNPCESNNNIHDNLKIQPG